MRVIVARQKTLRHVGIKVQGRFRRFAGGVVQAGCKAQGSWSSAGVARCKAQASFSTAESDGTGWSGKALR